MSLRSNHAHLFFFGAIVLIAGVASSAAARDGRREEDPPLRIGAIDIGKVFRGDELSRSLEARINEEKNEIEQDVEQIRAGLIELRRKAAGAEGADQLRYLERKIELEAARLRLAKEEGERTLKERFDQYTTRIFIDIWDEVERFAEEKGYDYILKIEDPANVRKGDRLQTALQAVIYGAPRHDVTDEILRRLNAEERLREREKKDEPGPAEKKNY